MKPELLLGQVRSERQTADDYAGRELLELVQNAADAATEAGGGSRVDVDHLRGLGAYGWDRLSFESDSDRTAFIEDPKRTDLVARFIEVKSGYIELTETEVKAAELRGARYFIYRITFDDASRDSADLTMLADPLAYRQALLARYEFRIDAVGDRQRYQLQAAFDSEAEEQEDVEMAADVGI